ncbi:Hsp33 family molecular chaperone HslO [Fodinisporobacter ferrooxydans]|uniref:33 kDa chaperonin n=1 Tax=Fodinisporobacter ferrooxydans TaxID=2901836 RepID=A0ABY4CMX7_9BACL|nr:Hsp33 family molecular chaperone HslO [Alicyclobacillaceae bacterium MYW30-H2]
MSDYLVRAIAFDGKLRAFAALTKDTVEEIRKRHDTWPVATAAVGRTATATVMMGAMLKGDDRVTIQIKGGGPIGQIVADANAGGDVRAYCTKPHVDLPLNENGKLDVAGAVGTNGFLNVVKDLGLKEPYRGNVPLISGELGEDFTYYFTSSEQTPSAVGVGVLVNPDLTVRTSGGFIIQLLPGIEEDEIQQLENRLQSLPQLTTLFDQGLSPEDLLQTILPDASMRILDRFPIRFACTCSHDRLERVMISLGREELKNILQDQGHAEIICQFCKEAYVFDQNQLQNMIESLK